MNTLYFLTGTVVVLLVVAGVLWMKKHQPHASHPFEILPSSEKAKPHPGLRSKGPADATVQIIEFSDFQCPACKNAQVELEKILSEYPGKIHLVFSHFPLAGHPWSMIAHQGAECAHQEGKFWEYHDRLYGEQAVWAASANPTEFLLKYAGAVGLALEPFANCLTDKAVTGGILQDKAEGERLQVKSTPTFFLNGERVVGNIELGRRGREIVRKALGLPEVPQAQEKV